MDISQISFFIQLLFSWLWFILKPVYKYVSFILENNPKHIFHACMFQKVTINVVVVFLHFGRKQHKYYKEKI